MLLRQYKDITKKVKNNLDSCKKIKDAIIKSKNQGIKISSVLIEKYKLCKLMNVRYKTLREEVIFKKNQFEDLEKTLCTSSLDVLNSSLILGESLQGYNNILFRLSNPDREIKLNINETMSKKIFKLVEDEDGILKIVNTD